MLLTRGQSGRWDGPAFYNLGAASVGFQAGVEVSEVVIVVMTDKGLYADDVAMAYIAGRKTPAEALTELMLRPQKLEVDAG